VESAALTVLLLKTHLGTLTGDRLSLNVCSGLPLVGINSETEEGTPKKNLVDETDPKLGLVEETDGNFYRLEPTEARRWKWDWSDPVKNLFSIESGTRENGTNCWGLERLLDRKW
jgi:hypothetical protein